MSENPDMGHPVHERTDDGILQWRDRVLVGDSRHLATTAPGELGKSIIASMSAILNLGLLQSAQGSRTPKSNSP